MRQFEVPANMPLPVTETLGQIPAKNARDHPDRRVYGLRSGDGWTDVTAQEFHEQVKAVSRGLIARDVSPGDPVAVLALTSYEWTVLDFALWSIGAFAVPIYASSSADQIEWIVSNSGARVVITDTLASAERVRSALAEPLPVWVIDEALIATLTDEGASVAPETLAARLAAVTPQDIATIIYTSGTTGRPKGCVLTHANLVFETRTLAASFAQQMAEPDAGTLLFLPLAHVFGRLAEVWAAVGMLPLAHCPDATLLMGDLESFRPTFLISVPRLFEKVFNTAQLKAHAAGKGRIFDTAAKVAVDYSKARGTGRPSLLLRVEHALFDRLVYGKIRAAMGGRVRYAISGGAALGQRLGHFYAGVGLIVVEGYGLTETSAPITFNRVEAVRIGSVGQSVPGTAVRIADDGEVLMRGPNVMARYHNNPTATEHTFDSEGWFCSGDLGRLDDDGYLYIVGRKKELIVTAGGKNVAPVILEDGIQANFLVSQALVVGEGRPFIGALITLDPDALAGWAEEHHRPGRTLTELRDDPFLREEIQAAVDNANAAVSRAESVRAWRLLDEPFSEAAGHLTPTLKFKRAVIMSDFADEIERLYAR